MSEWQPIYSAPKDGVTILAWYSESEEYGLVEWSGDEIAGCWMDNFDGREVSAPTHWQPLPIGPSRL